MVHDLNAIGREALHRSNESPFQSLEAANEAPPQTKKTIITRSDDDHFEAPPKLDSFTTSFHNNEVHFRLAVPRVGIEADTVDWKQWLGFYEVNAGQ